ncbi:kelch 40a [Paramuricea clavata]|uniref:Kelch 40a n=1 Tax=Paramuricea clavata TaxID=317549 RepID=A0A6S7HQX2_PARCT|nr:kelch 40a [Paramuricea clavata]
MSRRTRKRSTAATSVVIKEAPKEVDPLLKNIFASCWKNSDTILVCNDTEFHVHRSILTMHSPVFEAMFAGNFEEANEKRIVLPGKNPDEMLQFLKFLYPDCMIQTPTIKFGPREKRVFAILRIADEYQTELLIKKCLKKVFIMNSNVFEILSYANKYDLKVRKKCVSHVARDVTMDELEKSYHKLEAQLIQELLVAKCRHLELWVKKYEQIDAVAFADLYSISSNELLSTSSSSKDSSN